MSNSVALSNQAQVAELRSGPQNPRFERQWWKHAGSKEQAVTELFGFSASRYYQMLNVLVDSPAALAYDPMLVKRLRRMRQARYEARTSRQVAR